MWVRKDFSEAAADEVRDFSFDFWRDLADDETVVSAVWSIAVVNGEDEDAEDHLQGAATVGNSEDSGRQTITTQRVSGLVAGVKYRLTALATTSAGQVLELYSHVACKAPA